MTKDQVYELRFNEMVRIFKHIHINNGVDDFCKECGLYLTHEVHERAQDNKTLNLTPLDNELSRLA